MTVARRLSLALGLHLVLLLALVTYHLRTIRHAVNTAHELSEVSANLVLSSARQSGRIAGLDEAAAKFAVTRDSGYLVQYDQLRAELSAELGQWDLLPATEEETRAIAAAIAAWRPLRTAPAGTADLDEMRERLDAVSETAQGTMHERLALAASDAARATRLSYLAALGALLLGIVTAVVLTRSITGPLRRLAAGTREVALGRFGYRLDTRRGDEFAQVADAFNTMTERLGALDRMKHDFVSSVSHDLKSPLASLRETTTLLLDGVPGPLAPKQRRLLLLQRESADRLGMMIAKLLDLSRLEAGLPLSVQAEAVAPILMAAATHATAAGLDRDVRVVMAGPLAELALWCDADRIRQLLDNLLENAIKFSPRGALVELAAHVRGEWLEITVADRGPGVPEAMREQVFERFFQTAEGRAVHGRGVGLGLTICRQIVQAHGGTITVEAREGGGACFRVQLPGVEVADNGRDVGSVPAVAARLAVLVFALASVGCVRSTFDDHLKAGRWEQAAVEFERDSSLHDDPDALRRAADVHAVPQRPEWDPERAARLYALARAHADGHTMPLSSERTAALVEEVLRLRSTQEAQSRVLGAQIAAADSTIALLRAERDSLARITAAHDEEIASRSRLIARLERSLQEREAEARSLRSALERLKAIDLKP